MQSLLCAGIKAMCQHHPVRLFLVCMHVCGRVYHSACVEVQRKTHRSQCSASTMWDPGTKLRASGAVTMAFTPCSHPIGPMFHFAYYFPFNHRDSLKLIHVLSGGGRTRSVCLGARTGCPKSRLYMLGSAADMTKCILGTAGAEQLRLRGHRV